MTQGRPYFTLNGSETDGWRLMMYRHVMKQNHDGSTTELDAVSPHWIEPKQFSNLQDALAELCEHEQVGTDAGNDGSA